MIDCVYVVMGIVDVIIINFVVFMYISVVFCDVLLSVNILFIEVYLLNVYVCELFCYYFYFFDVVVGVIVGFGVMGYLFVLIVVINLLKLYK